MNKRPFFILLPFLALLIFINSSGVYNCTSFVKPSAGSSVTAKSLKNNHDYSPVLNKDNQERNKNKIRIKACDDYMALAIPGSGFFFHAACYYTPATYGEYSFYFQSSCSCCHSLRGPPAA